MPSGPIELRGIAWNHTRGFLPVVATGQRFEELNPGITIRWEKRSLQAFADASMADLAAAFDLIVMDHPHTALAATQGLVLPMEDWLPTTPPVRSTASTATAEKSDFYTGERQRR